jgi:hypothetical protein
MPALRPDGLLAASLAMTTELELDERGRVSRFNEKINDGFDVAATIARYELLTARRLSEPAPFWYLRVLRYTSLEEAADNAGGALSDAELQRGFLAMVARNFGTGLLIGVGVYALAKIALLSSKQL